MGLVQSAMGLPAHLPSDTVLVAHQFLDVRPVQQPPNAIGNGDAPHARQRIARPFIHIAMHF